MKNLGTSLRRGVILIIYVSHYIIYEFWLKTAPASRLGQEQINNYSNFQLIYSKPSKSWGQSWTTAPSGTPKNGTGSAKYL